MIRHIKLKKFQMILIITSSISLVFLIWWLPFFLDGSTPLSECGYSVIWGDWLADRFLLVSKHIIPEWNPNNVLGVNYIGREPFFNPLGIHNLFKFLFSDPKFEWVFGLLFYLLVLGVGVYKFLRSQNISHWPALLGAVLITIYPKWMDDIYHGPGKFVTAYSMVPWVLYIIFKMFERTPRLVHFVCLGILGALIFLSSAFASLLVSYLIIPYFLYQLWRYLHEKSDKRLLDSLKIISGVIITCLLALGLSAYLLFPLLDNFHLSSRSYYAPPPGYDLLDLIGLFFPWLSRLYTMGYYDIPQPVPGIGMIGNIRSYFGILAIPLFVCLVISPELRRKYSFFWMWPLFAAFLYSKVGNVVFPIVHLFEGTLGYQASQNAAFFNFIFCFNLIIVATLDKFCSDSNKSNERDKHQGVIPPIVLKIVFVLLTIYGIAIFCWLTAAVLTHYYPHLCKTISSISIFSGDYIGLQLMIYSYFYDYFFYLILGSFVIRFLILWWFSSGRFHSQRYGLIILAVLMVSDFMIIPKIISPFNSSLDLRYSDKLEQNRFVLQSVNPYERIASHHIDDKLPYKMSRFIYAGERVWDPPSYYHEFKNSNPDNGFYEPLYDIGLTYYPVTVGKQIYNYHESLLPDYFYDFDKALNGSNPKYSRQSWIAVRDPYSPLLNVAGISYLFWYKPLEDQRFELVGRYPIGDGYIYRNKKAVPKAYLVKRLEYFEKRDDLLNRMKDKTFQPLHMATTEDRELRDALKNMSGEKGDLSEDSVRILSYEPNRIVIDATASSPSVLVVTDLFFPYWTAQVDGAPARIYRVNGVFRGLVVGSGSHRVQMDYRNEPFHRGLKISLATLIILSCLFAFVVYRERRKTI